MEYKITQKEVIDTLTQIYNNEALAISILGHIKKRLGLLWKKNPACSWEKLLSVLFTQFFRFREYVDSSEKAERTRQEIESANLLQLQRLLKWCQEEASCERTLLSRPYEGVITLPSEIEKFLASYSPRYARQFQKRFKSQAKIGMRTIQESLKRGEDAQSLQFPKWIELYFPFDVLKVNLTLRILLDQKSKGSQLPKYDLYTFYEKYSRNADKEPSQLSRFPLFKYPNYFKNAYGVSCTGKYYEICTAFPEVLAALIENQTYLPFQQKPSHTWNKDSKLYGNILSVIDFKDNWDGYIAYYQFEQLFRINTKIRLSLAFWNLKESTESKSKKITNNDDEICLAIKEDAKFFFSSPLVYIPDEYFTGWFTSDYCVTALHQMSAYYFPTMLCMAKYYLFQIGEYNDTALEQYLILSDSDREDCDRILKPLDYNDMTISRGQRDYYSKVWCDFHAPHSYEASAYQPQSVFELTKKHKYVTNSKDISKTNSSNGDNRKKL